MKESRILYSEEGFEIGKFKILDISGNKVLCECLDHSTDVNRGCYVKIGAISRKTAKPGKRPTIDGSGKEAAGPSAIIKVRGIRFIKQKNGSFITENPVPASMVPDISFNEIEKFMKKIGNRFEEKFKVSYLETSEIKEYFINGEEKILLGVKNGLPVIVSFSESGFRENPVSEKIISKLKYEIYIPLKLKRL